MELHAMSPHPLKAAVKRGALIAAANWQVTLIQASAASLFRLLLAVPVVGSLFLVALAIGRDPSSLMSLAWRDMSATIALSLMSHPTVLAMCGLAIAVVVVGGSLFVVLVRAGTVATLVQGDRHAGPLEEPPLRFPVMARASRFSIDGYLASASSLFPRYARLCLILIGVYAASRFGFLLMVTGRGQPEGWGLAALLAATFVLWITGINLTYLLVQVVVAADNCSVMVAVYRVAFFLRREAVNIGSVFLLLLGLVVIATGASILATVALGLVAFVPFVGLAVLSLQVLAWLLRGLVFQCLSLTAVGAFLKLYGTFTGRSRDGQVVAIPVNDQVSFES
jgi:hypothetical protein